MLCVIVCEWINNICDGNKNDIFIKTKNFKQTTKNEKIIKVQEKWKNNLKYKKWINVFMIVCVFTTDILQKKKK